MTPFRLALVGAGKITAGSHLPAALALPFVEVAAIVDPVAERAHAAAAWFGRTLPHAVSIEEVVGRIDGALVATPDHTHHAIARTLLEAGVPTLVEKPLALSAADATALAELAQARGVLLTTGFCTRFRESFAIVERCVRDGCFGPVESFHHADGNAGGWAPFEGYRGGATGGGVLTVTGSHFLDRVTAWFGAAQVVEYRDDSAGGPEANVEGLLEFARADGSRFRGRMRLSKTTRLGNATMIRFRDGVLRTADGDVPVTFRPHGSPLVHALSWPDAFAGWVGKTVFERQIEDFVAAARGERAPRVPTSAGVDQARLAEALYAARRPLLNDWRAEAA